MDMHVLVRNILVLRIFAVLFNNKSRRYPSGVRSKEPSAIFIDPSAYYSNFLRVRMEKSLQLVQDVPGCWMSV